MVVQRHRTHATCSSVLQVHAPASLPGVELLHLVHTPDYVERFCSGTLGALLP